MRPLLASVLLSLPLALPATAALAHAELEKADPAAGGTVVASPGEIRLDFSEGVEPALSGIVLADAAGKKVATGKPATAPKKDSELVVPVPHPLAAGAYTVKWHAVAVDSHKTQGTFTFTVKP
jgi:methionine-rich copper-binding protein CopC